MGKKIQLSAKGFGAYAKNYPTSVHALNEIAVNANFAPNVSNINFYFSSGDTEDENVYDRFWCINDGDPLSYDEIERVVSVVGCESANTAGNENGTGIKSCASYFTQNTSFADPLLFFGSKENGKELGLMWINKKGEYCYDKNELTREQLLFINSVMSTFERGCVTAVYHSSIEKEDAEKFKDNSYIMFTTRFNDISFTIYFNGEANRLSYYDRLYSSLDLGTERLKENNITFSFEHKRKGMPRKIYKCSIEIINMDAISPSDFNMIDNLELFDKRGFGIHVGYDNGYMPICERDNAVEIIGLDSKPQYYPFRGVIIAHPVNDDERYANVDDWKKFYSFIGRVGQQKVPNLNSKVNYKFSHFEEFNEGVIKKLTSFISERTGSNTQENGNDEFSEEECERLNAIMENRADYEKNDKYWKFRFGKTRHEDYVMEYNENERTVLFNFFSESPLIKRIIVGGRNGRNGHNDLDSAILTTVDVCKMAINRADTSAGSSVELKKIVKEYNLYYSL